MSRSAGAVLLSVWIVTIPAAYAAENVQRQLQSREQQQRELQLKMQQQAERATQPPSSSPGDLQRRMLERDQQQRLQQLHEQQSRESAAAAPDKQHELERQRGSRAAEEELKRFEAERRLESGRVAP